MELQSPDDQKTSRAHNHQLTWQILVPFIVMMGLIIAGAVLIVSGGESQTSVWADVSAIWLIIPILFLALAFLILVITIIYGMAKLLQIVPLYSFKVQHIMTRVATGTRKVTDGSTKPFFWINQAGAVVKSMFTK